MKKRYYILLAVVLAIAFVCVSLKTGTIRIEKVWDSTEGVMTIQVVDNISGETNETTTLSVDEQEVELLKSDYETESDYKRAIAEAKKKLGFREKQAER